MRKEKPGMRFVLFSLCLVIFGTWAVNIQAKTEEEFLESAPINRDLSESPQGDSLGEEISQRAVAEDIAGELLLELKEGKTLADISDLNRRYGISTGEQAFKTFLETQKQKEKEEPKRPTGPTTKKHEGWYWQLDKKSQESQEYEERVAKEKEESRATESIQIIQAEQKISQGELGPYKLGNIYVLRVPKGADTAQIVQDYKAHPAVKNAAFQGK